MACMPPNRRARKGPPRKAAMTMDVSQIREVTAYTAPCFHSEQVQYCWPCPGCGQDTLGLYTEQASKEAIAQDARCWSCRRTATKASEPQGALALEGRPRPAAEGDSARRRQTPQQRPRRQRREAECVPPS